MATRDEVGVEAFRAWHRAEEAARRLSRRDFSGRQGRLLLGPEDVSMRKATRLIGSLLGLTWSAIRGRIVCVGRVAGLDDDAVRFVLAELGELRDLAEPSARHAGGP